MKVSELIELLQCEDQNSVVKIARYQSFYGWDNLSNPTVGTAYCDDDFETGHEDYTNDRCNVIITIS